MAVLRFIFTAMLCVPLGYVALRLIVSLIDNIKKSDSEQ